MLRVTSATGMTSGNFYRHNYLSKYDKKNVIYLAYVGQVNKRDIYKYGKSSDVFNREYLAHRKTFKTFEMVNIFQTNYKDHVETLLEKELKVRNLHQELIINRKRQTELFMTTDIYPLTYVETMLKGIIDDYEMIDSKITDMRTDMRMVELEMAKIELEKLKVQMKIKEYELEHAKFLANQHTKYIVRE